MLTIRLRRAGAKRDPHYRVVVADRAAGRDGPFLEIVGHYHPRRQPAEVVFNVERTEAWLSQGARMSDTVRSLFRAVKSGRPTGAAGEETAAAAPPQVTEAAAEAEAEATSDTAAAEAAESEDATTEEAVEPEAEEAVTETSETDGEKQD